MPEILNLLLLELLLEMILVVLPKKWFLAVELIIESHLRD
jgi:hypothetical protein